MLWAATQGIGSARKVARLCAEHDAYRWLCGGVNVNHHTLSDFRCATGYARARAELGGGVVLDLVFTAGPSGWRELASAPDLAGSPSLAALPPDVRTQLGL